MRFQRRAVLTTASAAVAALLVGGSAAGSVNHTAVAAGHAVPVVGHVDLKMVRIVKVSTLPQTTSGVKKHIPGALTRSGKPTYKTLPSRPTTGSKPVPNSAASPLVLTHAKFNGIGLATADCGCQPPDVNAAVGPNNIVESVNLEYAVYNKTGTLLGRTSLNSFFGTGDGLSDPRVLYDSTWNRWTLTLTDTSSPSLWMAFSQSGDPQGGWWIYHVGFPFAAGSIVDYPMTGMDDTSITMTSNNFDPSSSYLNSTAFTFPKARVYNGFGWGASLFGVNYNTAPAVVAGIPTQQTSVQYLLSPDDANNLMYVYKITNRAENPVLTFKGSIAYNWAAPPRRVNQPGTTQTLDPLDGRIDWQPVQWNGNVWFAHGSAVGSFPAVNWGFVNTANMSIHFSTAFHSATSDDFNPSLGVAINPNTNVVDTIYLNWAYTDTPNSIPTTDVAASTNGVAHVAGAPFGPVGSSTSEFRFGDYSSVAINPVVDAGCSFIGSNAVVANEYFDASGNWATRIADVGRTC